MASVGVVVPAVVTPADSGEAGMGSVPHLETLAPPGAPKEIQACQTVIRLKRRIEDSPSKILLVSCKRAKTDADGEVVGDGEEAGSSGGQSNVPEVADKYTQVLRLVATIPETQVLLYNVPYNSRNFHG